MGIHNNYLLAISALFTLIFAIMLYSLIRHRKADDAPRRFGGATGRVQWLWALVPMVILGLVNIALIDQTGRTHRTAPAAYHDAAHDKVSLAAVHK